MRDNPFWLLFLGIFILMLAGLLDGCTFGVDHKIKVAIDLEDPCLTAFPECSGDSFFCVHADGTRAVDCEATCLAASSRMCTDEGPVCLQIGEEVPSLCIGSR
jgi:hypothetical protein